MGYYVRVLGTHNPDISLDELINSLKAKGLSVQLLVLEDEQPDNWTILQVANANGDVLAQVERNQVVDGELGNEELEEFIENIAEEKPVAAVNWLTEYLKNVTVIYAFQILSAGLKDENFDIIAEIRSEIWEKTGGILQADQEGFTNEDGYQILWQFSDTVSGQWSCAVRNILGQWEKFTMDLGDPQQRREFKEGKVPQNAVRV